MLFASTLGRAPGEASTKPGPTGAVQDDLALGLLEAFPDRPAGPGHPASPTSGVAAGPEQ